MNVVGIDLGTTNTVVGSVRGGKVHVLADEDGVRLLPSVVSFHPNGEILVGGAARARRIIDARHTVYSHKRLLGRSWGSPEIAQARARLPFDLREGPGQGPLIHARGQDYTLPEISAFVLKRARIIAEQALGGTVDRAVITVPAHFNELQRASTKVAGRVCGLEVLRILNEPTAAALAYGLGRTGSERVAVYDFGGGTFDCTLLDLSGNVFEVLATAGDSFLGGDDIDDLIASRMAETFLQQHRQDARADAQMFARLKATAEDVKIALSTAESHTVVLSDFGHGAGGSTLSFSFTMTRRDLDALLTPLVDRTFGVTEDALALARLSPASFDKVILVGGSTRIPLVRERVARFFGGPPMDRVNPDEVVAIGAAVQAAALSDGIPRRSIPSPPAIQRRRSQPDAGEARAALPSFAANDEPVTLVTPDGAIPAVPAKAFGVPESFLSASGIPMSDPPSPPPPPDTEVLELAHGDALLVTDESPADTEAFHRDDFDVELVDEPPQEDTLTFARRAPAPPEPPARGPSQIPTPIAPMVPTTAPMARMAPAVPATVPMAQMTPPPPPVPPVPPTTARLGSLLPSPPESASPARASGPRAAHTPFTFGSGAPPPGSTPPPAFSAFSGAATRPAPILVDVTPRALVVETAGGYTDTVITRNAKIPCERTRRFTTGRDMQTTVRVRVAQGENKMFAQNTYLGEVQLSALRPAARGEVTVAVTFEVDADGTIRVRARDIKTNQEASATLRLVGVADEPAVAAMMHRVAHQPVSGRSQR